jgi:1,2-diacylglycerol 3-alpha-glucosyltransferase
MKSSILIFQQIVPAYRVPIFKAFYFRFNSILCHSIKNRKSKIRSATDVIDYPHEIIKNYDKFGTWQTIIPVLLKYKPKIVIAGVAATNFTFIKLLLLKKVFHYKLIAWGHGVHNKEVNTPFKGLRGKLMIYFLKKSDAIVFYSFNRKNTVEQLFPSLKEKLFVAPNTLDLTQLGELYRELKNKGKSLVQKELGENFDRQFNLIFIGRLLPDKRINMLIKVFEILNYEFDIALHIIGNGKEDVFIKQHKLYQKNIFYYGAIYEDAITSKYLFASDLFIMPGYIGLSILHAFAFGIPVATCAQGKDGPFHSPEIEYLQNGINGILCSSVPEIMAKEIMILLKDSPRVLEMKKNAEQTAYQQCTIESMLQGFEKAIHYVTSV